MTSTSRRRWSGDDANAYAATKRDTDAALAEVDGITRVILRPPAILGAGESSIWNSVRPAEIRDDPQAPPRRARPDFAWVHVDDLAALAAAVASGRVAAVDGPRDRPVDGGCTAVNVAAEAGTVRDYYETVTTALGLEPVWDDGTRVDRPDPGRPRPAMGLAPRPSTSRGPLPRSRRGSGPADACAVQAAVFECGDPAAAVCGFPTLVPELHRIARISCSSGTSVGKRHPGASVVAAEARICGVVGVDDVVRTPTTTHLRESAGRTGATLRSTVRPGRHRYDGPNPAQRAHPTPCHRSFGPSVGWCASLTAASTTALPPPSPPQRRPPVAHAWSRQAAPEVTNAPCAAPEILDVTRAQDDASSQHGVASVAISCAIRNTTETEVRVPDIYIDGTWLAARGRAAGRSGAPPTGSSWRPSTRPAPRTPRRPSPRRARAFDDGPWPRTSARERGDLLLRVADLLERDKDDVARAESLDTGKRLVESEYDVDDVVSVFRHYGRVAAEDAGRVVDTGNADVVSRIVHEPVGVCGADHAVELPAAAGLLEGRARASPPATPSCSSRASSPRTPRST